MSQLVPILRLRPVPSLPYPPCLLCALPYRHRWLHRIYVNFPEPPSDHGNADEYLINAAFLTNCHRALRPDGHGLLIVSDNPILLETVATTLGGLMAGSDGGRALSFATARPGPLVVEGVPHGFGAEGTSSYFDRLWQSRAKQRRYHIHVIKK